MNSLKYSSLRPVAYSALVFAILFILSGCGTSASLTNSAVNPVGTDPTGQSSDPTLTGGTGTQTGTSTGTGLSTGSTGTKNSQNQSPAITIKNSQTSVGCGVDVDLSADAIDPDGDLLSFSWTASGGTFISQTANNAKWKSPTTAGSAEISCTADDRKGGKSAAKIRIDVVGGRTYQAKVSISRYSTLADNSSATDGSEWLPVSNAQLLIKDLNQTVITDNSGICSIALDGKMKVASGSEVVLKYRGVEIHYQAIFPNTGTSLVDQIQIHPGYEGVSVAVARGDSFSSKRGGVDVQTAESVNGQSRPLTEVTVEVGNTQQVAPNGTAFLSVVENDSMTSMNIKRTGYADLADLRIPVSLDGLTIVNAQMNLRGSISATDAAVSWTVPYNGQKTVSINGPFEIGFSQPMEAGTIFDELEMTIQDSSGKSVVVMNGAALKNFFNFTWQNVRVLRLTPKIPMSQLKKYSLHVTRWNARALDGRILKSYASIFGNFTTDSDQPPKVVSTSPRNGDQGVSLAGPFTVKFDQPMDTSSLEQNFQIEITDLKGGFKVVVDQGALANVFSISWLDKDATLSLVPRKMLKPQNPYMIRILKTGLKSKTGKPVENMAGIGGQFLTGSL